MLLGIAECDRKLARHRAALEAGADPKIVKGWIAEVEAERRRILATIERPAPRSRRMTREEISAMVQRRGRSLTCCGRRTSPTGLRCTSSSACG
jgi:hypothetical protein